MRRGICTAAGTCAAMLALAPVAQADHHLVKITEVFPGTTAQPGAEFVELQLYSAGQSNFSPAADLVFYNAAGGTAASLDLDDLANSSSQRTLLAATTSAESLFTVQADTEYVGSSLANEGGGVCLVSSVPSFGTIDCVAWGTATVAGAGTSEAAIPDGSSLERSTARGCNTLLEAGDDTDSSLADFAPAFPQPRPNGVAPTQSSCPNTVITRMPQPRTTDRTPVFNFEGSSTFECKLDSAAFVDCSSPYKPGRQELGRHKLQVRATEADGSIDGTPEKFNWNIIRR